MLRFFTASASPIITRSPKKKPTTNFLETLPETYYTESYSTRTPEAGKQIGARLVIVNLRVKVSRSLKVLLMLSTRSKTGKAAICGISPVGKVTYVLYGNLKVILMLWKIPAGLR